MQTKNRLAFANLFFVIMDIVIGIIEKCDEVKAFMTITDNTYLLNLSTWHNFLSLVPINL